VAAAHQDPPPQRGAPREAVDPAHGVRPVLAGIPQAVEHRSEPRHGLGLHDHPRAVHRLQAECHLGDEPGQPHAADRGEEELALALWAALDHAAVGDLEHQAIDETSERAVAVVVLAVHVAGDAAADGHELRPRRHRRKPAPRQEDAQDLGEREPGLAGERAPLAVEGDHAVGPRRLEDERAGRGRHGRVTVGSAEPAGQDRAAARRQQEPFRPHDGSALDGVAAPARDGLEVEPRRLQLGRL